MRRILLATLTCAAALLLAAPGASAGDEISGTFQVMENGKVVGAERFAINFGSDGRVTSESQGALKMGPAETKDYTKLSMRTLSGPINTYQREAVVDKLPRGLGATYDNGVLNLEVRDGPRKRDKRLTISPATVVVDVGVWHHLHLLLQRYSHRTGGEQSFTTVIPSEMRLADPVTVRHIGREPAALQNGWFVANKYFFNRGDVGLIVWADSQGRIIKIDSPQQGFTVELLKYEGERAAEVSPVKVLGADLDSEPVQVEGQGVKLGGALTRPRGVAGRLPGVIYLSDTGKHDRDGNAVGSNINVGTRELLDQVTKAGFAVLRMDDRGVGESEGDLSRATVSMLAADAGAMVDFLKQRSDIDPTRLALIGLGEGANVAATVAAKRADVKTLVLLAPCDVPLTQLAEEQIKHRLTLQGETDPTAWERAPIAVLMRMAREKPDLKSTQVGGHVLYLDPYRDWARMRPVDDLKATAAKILHAQGGRDLQVFPRHAEGFRRALANEKRYTFKAFDNLNHFFQASRGTIGEYADPTAKVDPAFLAYLTDWLKANL